MMTEWGALTKERAVMRGIAYFGLGIVCGAGAVGLFGWEIFAQRQFSGRSVILPHASFNHDRGIGKIELRGTWQRDDSKDALPNQTTTIECWRSENFCIEVTAALADTGFMPLDINRMKVVSWNEQVVVVCGSTGLATSERYVIDVKLEAVSGVVGPKSEGDICPKTINATLKMIDGHIRSLSGLKKGS
jgi:hypothetical protein